MSPKHDSLEIQPIYFRLHLKILFYLGIDILPMENPSLAYIFYFYRVLVMGILLLFTLTEFLDMILNFEDIYKMTFILCYFFTHILGNVKMCLMIMIRKQLWDLLKTLEEGTFKANLNRGGILEVRLIKNAIRMCYRQGYFFYTMVVGIVSARAFYAALANLPYGKNFAVIDNSKIMPYTTWLPFDYNTSPLYELIFAFQIFSTITYGFYIGATDCIICGFMMLVKAQFLIVKRELETVIERAVHASNATDMNRVELLDANLHQYIKRMINDCVDHHLQLIALCDRGEKDFSVLMLLQFISSCLIVCFQLFQLSTLTPGSIEFFSMSMYMILMLFQLLCYCWHGNEVQIVSGDLSRYAYNMNWIIMTESSKRTLLLMMMRSQRPCYFTAGKFSLLSLETFMTIVRGAGSYFMFLRQMNA